MSNKPNKPTAACADSPRPPTTGRLIGDASLTLIHVQTAPCLQTMGPWRTATGIQPARSQAISNYLKTSKGYNSLIASTLQSSFPLGNFLRTWRIKLSLRWRNGIFYVDGGCGYRMLRLWREPWASCR